MNSMSIQDDIERKRAARMAEIGERLREARKTRRLSQSAIAEACAVTSQSVSNWENGEFLIGDELLEKAAKRLGVSVEWLRTGRGPKIKLKTKDGINGNNWSEDTSVYDDVIVEMKDGVGSGAEYSPKAKIHGRWTLPQHMLRMMRVNPTAVKAFPVLTDYLAPEIKRGDVVFVDFQQNKPVHGGIFAIDNGLSIILKRLSIKDIDIKKVGLSDSKNSEPVWVNVAKVKIIGRVVGNFCIL